MQAATARNSWRGRVADYLSLERNVAAASLSMLLLGTGAIGLFGTADDLFDALYQYPSEWLADRLGRRRAFIIFIAVAFVGYLIYLVSPSWPFLFVGLAF